MQNCEWLWPEYYEEFPYFSKDLVRAGCHPRKMVHYTPTGRSVVLVHGLTDSPYFMSAVGHYFYQSLGYSVYIPLLQCHGLIDPRGMAGVSLSEWKENVRFAMRTAAANGDQVSIGGLSTGGSLCFFMAYSAGEAVADLYLFSPALGLYGGGFEFYGRMQEYLLRMKAVRYFDSSRPLIGPNPYRYARVSWNSAGELALLIRENLRYVNQLRNGQLLPKRTFAAWTEFDRVISLQPLLDLEQIAAGARFISFVLPGSAQVDHASVVLEEPLYALDAKPGDPPLEAANPFFSQMAAAIAKFAGVQPFRMS